MAALRIPIEERRWLTESFVDPNGRLFEWQGELYRELAPTYAPFLTDLFKRGVIAEFIRDGLCVNSEMTGAETYPGGLVVKHQRVPVVSYCFEWSPTMLKDAALLTLDLCIRLSALELTLQDGHPWNILFDGPNPVFIDLSSIVPARADILWAPYQQFCNFFLYPLYLYSAGRDRLARSLLHEYLDGVTDGDVLAALPLSFKLRHPRRTLGIALQRLSASIFAKLSQEMQDNFVAFSAKLNHGPARAKVRLKFLESLRKKIEEIRLPSANSHWAKYYGTSDQSYFLTDLSPADWAAKQETVEKILQELLPATVLDVGTNTGRYARMAAANGARVIACDLDVAAIDLCYGEARKNRQNLLPVVADVFSRSPIPGRGGTACPSAAERFRSDFVMGLAVLHHVVARQRLDIERIAETFDRLCSRWLLLEFVPPLKPKTGATAVVSLDDYSSDGLQGCLRKRFKSVVRHSSYPKERELFLCAK
jgi:SAM-dependent methyltransferase